MLQQQLESDMTLLFHTKQLWHNICHWQFISTGESCYRREKTGLLNLVVMSKI
jgi:hypothetical protein